MATADTLAVGQTVSRTNSDEVLVKAHEMIVDRTGPHLLVNQLEKILDRHRPISYDHLIEFKRYIDRFIHPNPPRCYSGRMGTMAVEDTRIVDELDGWQECTPNDVPQCNQIFNRFSEEDRKLAYDKYFLSQGRAPRLLEFARYLLDLEGNDIALTDTTRKILGNLFLECRELKQSLEQNLDTLRMMEVMMSSKDSVMECLGRSDMEKRQKIEDLEAKVSRLQQKLSNLQQEKSELQLEKICLQETQRNMEIENSQLLEDKIRLEIQLRMVDDVIVRLEGNLCCVENQMSTLKQENIELKHDNLQLQKTVTTVQKDKKVLKCALGEVSKDLTACQQKLMTVEQTLTTVEQDKNKLAQTLTTVEQTLTTVEQDKNKLAQTLTTVEQDKNKLAQTLTTVEQDKNKLAQTLTTVEQDKNKLAQTLTTVEQDKNKLAQTLTTVEQDNVTLQRQLKFFQVLLVFAFLAVICVCLV